MLGTVGAAWGFIGIVVLLLSAIVRLSPMAVELIYYPLSILQWIALTFSLVFMGFAEGYRGFQKNFAPRVAARVRYLKHNPTPVRCALAPLFCMGFFYTTRRRQIISIAVTSGIVLLVILLNYVPQPWRGIIDAGVVVGLIWGLIALVLFTLQAMVKDHFHHSPETP